MAEGQGGGPTRQGGDEGVGRRKGNISGFREEVSGHLKAGRARAHLTLEQLRKQVERLGKDSQGRRSVKLSAAHLSRIERREVDCDLDLYFQLCRAMGINPLTPFEPGPHPLQVIRGERMMRIQSRMVEEDELPLRRREIAHQAPVEARVYHYLPLSRTSFTAIQARLPHLLEDEDEHTLALKGEEDGHLRPTMRLSLAHFAEISDGDMAQFNEGHDGEEVLYVVQGKLEAWFKEPVYKLDPTMEPTDPEAWEWRPEPPPGEEQAKIFDKNTKSENGFRKITLAEGDILHFKSRRDHSFRASRGTVAATALLCYTDIQVAPITPDVVVIETDPVSGIPTKREEES